MVSVAIRIHKKHKFPPPMGFFIHSVNVCEICRRCRIVAIISIPNVDFGISKQTLTNATGM